MNKFHISAFIFAYVFCLSQFFWADAETYSSHQQTSANNTYIAVQNENADNTVTHTNSDLSDGTSRCGWSIQIPKTWVSIPDVSPGWPIAEGWRTPDGKTSIIITWLKDINESEYATLRSRRYLESSEQAAGRPCRFFRKINGPTFEQILYIANQGSFYRIAAFGTTQNKAALQKAMASFKFLDPSTHKADLETYRNDNLAVSFTLPSNSELKAQPSARGINVLNNSGETVVSINPRSFTAQPGQSFRGMARQAGRDFIPNAQKLTRFEPCQISGQTGYLAVWETTDGQYIGPIIYVPYKHGNYNILELESKDPKMLEQFFKIANTLTVSAPSFP
ncbi:MAG: hypothetical protein ACI38Q_04310 [Candidatus Bruticola sp.]